jgi:hypothetical protein
MPNQEARNECDKISGDPVDLLGPFSADLEGLVLAWRCEACGKTVFREPKPGQDYPPPPPKK